MDKFQERYLIHQERKKKIISGEVEQFVALKKNENPNFFSVAGRRQSQRIFNEERILDDKLDLIKETIINTPSSCNRQAVQVKIVRSSDDKDRIEEFLVGGKGWINKANVIMLLMADMEAYKSPAEVDFMQYLDAGFIGMSAYYAAETLGIGCCFVNPNIREENKEKFEKIFNKEKYKFCGAIALGHYDRRVTSLKKNREIFM